MSSVNRSKEAGDGSKQFKVAAIGTGNIFKAVHIKPWLAHPSARLFALCDIVETKAKDLAEEHDVPHVFADYRDVLAMDDVQIVDICTPNALHSEIAVAALEAGKHVFCEKPDAINAAEARKMVDAAKASGKVLMVMRNNRFRTDTQFAKRYIDSGRMGEIYTGRCGWLRRRGIPGKGGWFTTKEMSGGGPLIDLGVHMIDLAIWLMGSPKPVAVSGATYTKFADVSGPSDSVHAQFGEAREDGTFDVEDLAIGFIRFDNGATLQVECSWASNVGKESNFVQLRGTEGGLSLGEGEPLKIFTEFENTLCDVVPHVGRDPMANQHGKNINHFMDVVLGEAKPTLTPKQGLHMIQILSAMYESARIGREIEID